MYSCAKLAILAYSDDSDISSANAPSADILPPAAKNCSGLLPAMKAPADLTNGAFVRPVLATPRPPTPPVHLVSKPNSTRPLASLPIFVVFSGS